MLLRQTNSQQNLNVNNMQTGKSKPWGLQRICEIYTAKMIQWGCGILKYKKLTIGFLQTNKKNLKLNRKPKQMLVSSQ